VSYAIRRAGPDDAALLAEHRARVWYEYGERPDDEIAAQIPPWERWMRRAVGEATYVAFVAEQDGETIASAALIVHAAIPRPHYASDRDARIHSVYVAPEHRRRGIARALMAHVLEHARAHGIMRVTLHPTDTARPLYAALGFEPLDEMGLRLPPP
jgi:GNAT superfamily N-acetyltransferase